MTRGMTSCPVSWRRTAALRELALREVARDQGLQREQFESLKREAGRGPLITERVMVCLSANPYGSDELLRKAARAAARRSAEWYAVHVETPAESIQKIGTADFRALLDNINLAADLGAEVVWLKSPDVTRALLEFAQDKEVTLMIIGRTRPDLWSRIFRRSLASRLLAQARDFDLEIVARQPNAS